MEAGQINAVLVASHAVFEGHPDDPNKYRVIGHTYEHKGGLSLRDHVAVEFIKVAAKAIDDGYCGEMELTGEDIGKVAYQMADGFLKARKP